MCVLPVVLNESCEYRHKNSGQWCSGVSFSDRVAGDQSNPAAVTGQTVTD